jgi:hypothetical protein
MIATERRSHKLWESGLSRPRAVKGIRGLIAWPFYFVSFCCHLLSALFGSNGCATEAGRSGTAPISLIGKPRLL